MRARSLLFALSFARSLARTSTDSGGVALAVRFFPHEVSDLSLLVALLAPPTSTSTLPSSSPTASTSTSSSSSARTRTLPPAAPWELRYALLLWLSVCVRLPFALALLAPGTARAVERLGRHWVERSGREGEGAQEVLGRYFARTDAELGRLVEACEEALRDPDSQALVRWPFSLPPLSPPLCPGS